MPSAVVVLGERTDGVHGLLDRLEAAGFTASVITHPEVALTHQDILDAVRLRNIPVIVVRRPARRLALLAEAISAARSNCPATFYVAPEGMTAVPYLMAVLRVARRARLVHLGPNWAIGR